MEIPNWPKGIKKPELPHPYKWEMLRPALGLKNKDGTYKWFSRVSWTIANGKQRILKSAHKDYADTPHEAIIYAIKAVNEHIKKRTKP